MSPSAAPALFFLPQPDGLRLCVHHAPASAAAPARAAVVYVPPFGEEMNKSRRMASLQSRALAQAGCAVLQIDLKGCGDSSGDLGDVRWDDWLADVQAAADWLTQHYPTAPLWLWGLRAGALLAAEAAQARAQAPQLLFWQPLLAGKTQVQQLLRLKAAAHLSDGAAAKAAMAQLRAALAAGETVNVAGYPLPGALAQALEAATLARPPAGSRLRWFELSTRPEATLMPASSQWLAASQTASTDVQARVLSGPAFWQSTEIEEAQSLLSATVQAVTA